jgi:hypothetical protein
LAGDDDEISPPVDKLLIRLSDTPPEPSRIPNITSAATAPT